MPLHRPLVLCAIVSSACLCFAQAGDRINTQNSAAKGTLQTTKTVASSDIARDFTMPLQCDADGNVYFRSDSDGFPSIHKISPKGERTATFAPASCSDIKVQHLGQFFVAPDGHMYAVGFPSDGRPQVMAFSDDGACHSKIKLDTPLSFIPYQLVVFPSDNMLISGTLWNPQSKQYVPYTGLFSSSGTVLKDVDFGADAEEPPGSAAKKEAQSESSQNHAVSGGAMLLAADNNAYLIRREATPTVYALSEGGVVARHFPVDPGEPDLVTEGMQITGNRIAILFAEPKAHRILIKVVDMEGKSLALYDAPSQNGTSTVPPAFACYSYPPETFTFLSSTQDDKVVLKTVEPR